MDGVHTSILFEGVQYDSLVVKRYLTSRMERETVDVDAGHAEVVIPCQPL